MRNKSALLELPVKKLSLVELVLSLATELVPLPTSTVCIAIMEPQAAESMFQIILIVAFIDIPTRIFVDSFAMLQSTHKFTLVAVSIAVAINPTPVLFVVLPFALVVAPICKAVQSLPIDYPTLPNNTSS